MATISPGPQPPHLPLPLPFSASTPPPSLISQGAEALLLHIPHHSSPAGAALKYRPPKPYRHPTLDARLTRARVLAEARVLLRCARERVPVPSLLALGAEEGWVMLEWIAGRTVKDLLKRRRDAARTAERAVERTTAGNSEGAAGEDVKTLLRMVGSAVARLHAAGVVHGDLTSSNMILRPRRRHSNTAGANAGEGEAPAEEEGDDKDDDTIDASNGDLVLIDFGLAGMGVVQDEDRAVDLYVLERAFGSTHPELEGLFAAEVLGAYGEGYKGAKVVLKRLEDVRMRGRKKSMLG